MISPTRHWKLQPLVDGVQAVTIGYCATASGKHSAADVVTKAQALLSEPELLRDMFVVGISRRIRRPGLAVEITFAAVHECVGGALTDQSARVLRAAARRPQSRVPRPFRTTDGPAQHRGRRRWRQAAG
jgi:hypothetical protein